MELVDMSSASLDTLRRVCSPAQYPTREEIEDTRCYGIVWLHWLQPESTRRIFNARQRDGAAATLALEEQAQLRLVSYSTWLAAIEELWPKPIKQLRQLRLLERQLKLGVKFCPSGMWTYLRNYEHFLRPRTHDAGRISSGDDDGRLDYARVLELAIPVRLQLRSVNYTDRAAQWARACEVVETMHEHFSRRHGAHGRGLIPHYRFVEMDISLESGFHEWPDAVDILTVYQRMATCGVRVRRELEPDSTWVPSDAAARVLPLVQDLMAIQGTQRGCQEYCAMDHIRVSLWDTPLLDGVFSAILASQSIRKVTVSSLRSADRGGRRGWQWIAVLFRLPIPELALDGGLFKMIDLAFLESALGAPNPLSLLFPSTMIPVDGAEPSFVASAGCFHLHPPSLEPLNADVNASMLLYDFPLENLQVISVDDDWVTVLLPGWGCAWVAHADVSLSRVEQSTRMGCGPRRLSLTNIRNDLAPVVLTFLRYVGEKIHAISLSSVETQSGSVASATTILGIVLATCPHLEELTIKTMSLPSLSIFTRAYEDQSLHVQRLILEKVELDDRLDSVRFFSNLAVSSHPMSRQLRSFSCTLRNRSVYFPAIRPVILHMLQRNQHLDEFQLDPGDASSAPGPDDTILQEEVDQINSGRLSSQMQLAFLSAVGAQQRATWSKSVKTDNDNVASSWRAIHLLDRDVLTTIFQFAISARFVRVESRR